MIQLECSNCKAVLAIDDAFAGGVCRCQYCGTIQTVPKAGQKATAAEGDSPKALFKRKARIESALSPYSEGLDRAADEIGSSVTLTPSVVAHLSLPSSSPATEDPTGSAGGAGGGTATAVAARKAVYVPTPSKVAQAAPAKSKKPVLIASIAAVALLAVAGGITMLAMSGGGAAEQVEEILSSDMPNIGGIPLEGKSVVYILDRSGVTQHTFEKMKEMCLNSVASLSSSRSFQIVVWNGHEPIAYPKSGLKPANGSNLGEARSSITNIYAGASNLVDHLKSAQAAGAKEVVILSAVDPDAHLAQEIEQDLGPADFRLHAIAIGSDLDGRQMQSICQQFGGQFKKMPLSALN